jgi:hypothetical protein
MYMGGNIKMNVRKIDKEKWVYSYCLHTLKHNNEPSSCKDCWKLLERLSINGLLKKESGNGVD